MIEHPRATVPGTRSEHWDKLEHVIAEQAPVAVLVMDESAWIRHANATAHRVYGFAPGTLASKHLSEIDRDFDRERWAERWRHLQKNPDDTSQYERVGWTAAGQQIPVEVHASFHTVGSEQFVFTYARDIRERKQYEDTLHRIREAQEQAQRIARLGHWRRDTLTQALEWSAETYRIHGADPFGSEDPDVIFRRAIHPDDWEHVADAFRHSVLRKQPFENRYRLVMPDGAVKWVHARATVVYDGETALYSMGTVLDITDARRADERLRVTEERFKLALDGLSDGIFDRDVRTGEAYLSPSWWAMLGYAPDALEPSFETVVSLVHPDDRERFRASAHDLVAGTQEQLEIEMRMLHRTGRIVNVLSRASRLVDPDTGETVRVVGTQIDLTRRRAMEERSRHAEKMESLGRLVGGIAHDFNNILAALRGNTYLARKNIGHPQALAANLNSAEELVERAADMVGQLLTFARQESVVKTPLDVNDVVRSCYRLTESLIPENIRQSHRFVDGKTFVDGNLALLQQALVNLIANAVEAVGNQPEPRIDISVQRRNSASAAAEPSSLRPGQDYVLISVSDNGCGIPEEDLPLLFEPFFTTKKSRKGTGLGLASAFGAVTSHGGVLEVDSSPGKGATFRVYLPVTEKRPSVSQEARTMSAEHRQLHILLVDDDASVRTMSREVLESMGHEVVEAQDGRDALDTFERLEDALDLILCDVVMPQLGGVELMESVRTRAKEMPFLLVTGYESSPVAERLAGVADCALMRKPFRVHELQRRLTELTT